MMIVEILIAVAIALVGAKLILAVADLVAKIQEKLNSRD